MTTQMETIGTIIFRPDGEGSTLIVGEARVTLGVNPKITVRRDRHGRYQFIAGHKFCLIAPALLPQQIRAALQALGGRPGGAPSLGIRMPSHSDLLEDSQETTACLNNLKQIGLAVNTYEGSTAPPRFISYAEYDRRRINPQATAGRSASWPLLSEAEYNSYLSLCGLMLSARSGPQGLGNEILENDPNELMVLPL